MTFDKHELKLLAYCGTLALAGNLPPGGAIPLGALAALFPRPGKLRETVDKLRLHQFITYDPYKAELRILPNPVLTVLREFDTTPELFTDQRPLDVALAAVHSTPLCHLTRPPCEKTQPHVHVTSCNQHRNEVIHAHVPEKPPTPKHEVGELGRRTTTELLADISRLCPNLKAQHLDHWRSRIEKEDAELVNVVIRKCQQNRDNIRNKPAWMNSVYLEAVKRNGK